MAVSSSFLLNFSWLISFTLSILPRRGNTPHRSRPTTARPAIALAAAESPSVKISVHSGDLAVPAHSASSSLGSPRSVLRLEPSVFLASLAAFASRIDWASSRRPILTRASGNLSDLKTEPNLPAGVVRVSLVWESNDGFTMVALMKKTTESLS